MARMISQTQLSLNRLQKQLFMAFLLSDEQRRPRAVESCRCRACLGPLLLSSYAEKEKLCKKFVDAKAIIFHRDVRLHRHLRRFCRRCWIGSRGW